MAGTVTNASAGGSVTHLFLKIPTALVTFVYVDYAFTKLISLILAVDPRRWGHFISLWYNINRRDSEPPTLMLAPSPSHCSISQLSTHLSLRRALDYARAVAEARAEEDIRLFVKRPSLSETTMNCAPRNRVRKSVPMCCVCERSSAASISSRMYIGAGLNCSSAMISESAMSDLFVVRMCVGRWDRHLVWWRIQVRERVGETEGVGIRTVGHR
jgi:hypothetical protein